MQIGNYDLRYMTFYVLISNLILCCCDVSRCCNRTCRLHVHACSFDHPRSSLNTIIPMCAKHRFLLDLIAIWAFIANERLLKPFQNGVALFEPLPGVCEVETHEFTVDIFWREWNIYVETALINLKL